MNSSVARSGCSLKIASSRAWRSAQKRPLRSPVAVESIAQKLQMLGDKMLVCGAPERIGETAQRYLLEGRVTATPRLARLRKLADWAETGQKILDS